MNAIAKIHVELSSRCNKECGMCGRTPLRKAGTYPEGDMSQELAHAIATQIPKRTVVQFHWNGEPTMNPQLGTILSYYRHCVTGMDTNGKLLVEKANEIIGNIDTLTLSVIQDDPEAIEQFEILTEFLQLKGDNRPEMVYRLLGDVDPFPYRVLPGKIATRILHAPEMSRDYEKPVTIPEMGICLDMLHTVAIDWQGNVHHCVRFDPGGLGRIGELTGSRKASLEEIIESIEHYQWHNHPRQGYIDRHIAGQRHMVPLCAGCDFYGVPTGRFDPYGSKKKPDEKVEVITTGDFSPDRKEVSWLIPQTEEGTEAEETSEIPPPEGEKNEQTTGRAVKPFACPHPGCDFVGKTGAGIASHIRKIHEGRQ